MTTPLSPCRRCGRIPRPIKIEGTFFIEHVCHYRYDAPTMKTEEEAVKDWNESQGEKETQ